MSVLLIGAGGQLGQELLRKLQPITTWGPLVAVNRAQLDLANLDAIASLIEDCQPRLIFNTAAYTAVDQAEREPNLAYRINAEAPGVMARSAARCGAALVHISTDYVFDGKADSPRQEDDPTGPVNVYGQSKLAGEVAIREQLAAHGIIRTAWVYGTFGKRNFVKTMLNLGQTRPALSVVDDQQGLPTWAADLAAAAVQLAPRLLASPKSVAGTYHYTNRSATSAKSQAISWYEFALAIFEEARQLGLPLQVETVMPVASEHYLTPAARPAYSALNCEKISQLLGQAPPPWRQSLRQMLLDYASELGQSVARE